MLCACPSKPKSFTNFRFGVFFLHETAVIPSFPPRPHSQTRIYNAITKLSVDAAISYLYFGFIAFENMLPYRQTILRIVQQRRISSFLAYSNPLCGHASLAAAVAASEYPQFVKWITFDNNVLSFGWSHLRCCIGVASCYIELRTTFGRKSERWTNDKIELCLVQCGRCQRAIFL